MTDVSDPLLPFQCKTVAWRKPSVENTSSRKKTKVKKGSKVILHESPMLKRLIEELSTSPGSDEDNSESQPKTSE
ncbi:7034_t:CDS:2, partial [Funneliformis geosporum]